MIFGIARADDRVEPDRRASHTAIEQLLLPVDPVILWIEINQEDRRRLLALEPVNTVNGQLAVGQCLITLGIVNPRETTMPDATSGILPGSFIPA